MATDNEILIAGQGTFILNNITELTSGSVAIVL